MQEELSEEAQEEDPLKEEAEDPQEQSGEGAESDMSEVQKGVGENENLSIGIDMAGYQEGIDWQRAV